FTAKEPEGDEARRSDGGRRECRPYASRAGGGRVAAEEGARGEERRRRGMGAATPPAQLKPVPSPPSLTGRAAGPYDPKVNYTTPRPKFLRYDPERHREMLLRLAREAEVEDDCSSTASGVTASVASASSVSSATSSNSEAELDSSDEEEEEEDFVPARRGRWARRLFLLLVAVACSFCYIYCMNPSPSPVHSEDVRDFAGAFAGMLDAGAHELDSVRLLGLGPLYMMGPEDVLEETASETVQGDGEGAVHQYDQRASSRNLMAISMMGLADMCPSVQLGELACRIGDENSESVDDLKESSELSEQNAAVIMGSFENPTQGSSWAIGSASKELDSRMGLESEGLYLDNELWQYEKTAEAAREICSKLKFVWSAMEPHLLQILACLSVAGFVATVFKYYPRSWEITVPASQEMPSKSLGQVPVLVPHQSVQLPKSPSPLAMQLPVGSSDQHVQRPVPKQDLLEVPVQLPLPKSGPSVSFKVPVVDHGDHDQKSQEKDAETMKASRGNPRNHRDGDSSKPPVVELLGELTFADSSRGKPIRNLNRHAGDVSVQESLESLGEGVDKMLKNSSIPQTSSVRRARKEENAEKREKDVTLTPLRRSSRLRNKVTSP
ncbi:hypothetical protein EJB05_16867, partial [Eragrostis curvula]